MAINLAEKYSKKLVEKFYLDSVILGKTNTNYAWDGVKTVNVYSIVSQTPNNYSRTGSNRYGALTDVQDTYQALSVTQDKSNSLVVDKGDNTEQMMIKNAGKVANVQIKEQYIPMVDTYALNVWAQGAGGSATEALTNKSIAQAIATARTAFTNANVPTEGRYLYIGASQMAKLLLCPEYINLEKLGTEALEKGVVGKILGFKVVEVPDAYLPTNTNFIAVHKDAVVAPIKFRDLNVHQNPPGISGHQLDIRWIFDAFVLETKNKAVFVHKSA